MMRKILRFLSVFLLTFSFASAAVSLNVESSIVRAGTPVVIRAESTSPSELVIFDRAGRPVYRAVVYGRSILNYSFNERGVYIILLRDAFQNVKKVILVVPN